MLQIASPKSDHGSRVVEVKFALEESLRNTLSVYPALEIGNREGGSALYIMWHLQTEGKNRLFVTCDVNNAPQLLSDFARDWKMDWAHFKMTQERFIKDSMFTFGFVYLDADHEYTTVKRDLELLVPKLAKGCIVAVDDVHQWQELPVIEGLEQVIYEGVDQGMYVNKSHGQHVGFWRRV